MNPSADARPVAPTDRVSDVLARDEALVARSSCGRRPQFAKLRNRARRRVMARLVTVEQAARMAGVAPAALVGELNAALGIAAEPATADWTNEPREAAPQQPAHPPDSPVAEVDVREDLRAGREPFSKIMAAVKGLRPDQVLLLRATFGPDPAVHRPGEAGAGARGTCRRAGRLVGLVLASGRYGGSSGARRPQGITSRAGGGRAGIR